MSRDNYILLSRRPFLHGIRSSACQRQMGGISYKYDHALDFSEGLAAIKMGNKYGYINTPRDVVIPLKYEAAESFRNNLAKIRFNRCQDIIANTGKEIVPCKYKSVYPIEEDGTL
ncbi:MULTISPECIES: WG repeat-containing protein [Butyricimonas]|uniref:WG repeat-containing protein n=1 Tax=Butyricimonas TaxID=574697 RepID=UPI0011DE190A|nr:MULTISPECIES: WG repeat-containing protein [Butyricimonas]